jgi:hypothetical protein
MSELGDIPLIGGAIEAGIHGAEAIGDAVTGDWDGAAHEAYNMAGSAAHAVADDLTGGLFSAAEGVYDAAAPAIGLPTSDDISHDIEGGLHDLGNALGDGAYNLMNGDDGGLGGGSDLSAGAGAGQPDEGGQDRQDGGDTLDTYDLPDHGGMEAQGEEIL